MMTIGLNASPVVGSSCEMLVRRVLEGAASAGSKTLMFNLNDLDILPCQSCGESPYPMNCFYNDSMDEIYKWLIEGDIIVFGSPVYFDTVSAQAKLLIDRCNCLRPAIFPTGSESSPEGVKFLDRGLKKRKGVIILSGGQRQKFDCARTVIKGFFKWINIVFAGEIDMRGNSLRAGLAAERPELLEEAYALGKMLAGG